jgi:hypothetical protein
MGKTPAESKNAAPDSVEFRAARRSKNGPAKRNRPKPPSQPAKEELPDYLLTTNLDRKNPKTHQTTRRNMTYFVKDGADENEQLKQRYIQQPRSKRHRWQKHGEQQAKKNRRDKRPKKENIKFMVALGETEWAKGSGPSAERSWNRPKNCLSFRLQTATITFCRRG